MNKRSPTEIDIHVGKRLRRRRELLGLSQTEIGKRIDLTFQQIQKYENATNRISAGKLFKFGQILDVPICYFFPGFQRISQRNMFTNTRRMTLRRLSKTKMF